MNGTRFSDNTLRDVQTDVAFEVGSKGARQAAHPATEIEYSFPTEWTPQSLGLLHDLGDLTVPCLEEGFEIPGAEPVCAGHGP